MSNEILPAVKEGTADIGIGVSERSRDVQILPYVRDRLALVVSARHPLAKAEEVRFSDALDYDIIGLPERSGIQVFMRRVAQNSRKPMKSSVTVSSYEALCRMVAAGIGIGVIPERAASFYVETTSIRLVRLKDRSAVSDINICIPGLRTLPDYAKAFVDLLQERAQQ